MLNTVSWLAVILVDFVLNADENCYMQEFLKECKYMEEKGD